MCRESKEDPKSKYQKANKSKVCNNQKPKNRFDLEERTLEFSKAVVGLCKDLPYSNINKVLISQVVRSANSIGANYIEANEAVSKKDFLHKLKISRKEAKETIYHLKILQFGNRIVNNRVDKLIKEGIELKKILSAIINKCL